jgi:hypothetical protein
MPGEPRGAIVTAPFNPAQVLRLNLVQANPHMRHFTCQRAHSNSRALVATLRGWVCTLCPYTQEWAPAFMASWPHGRTHPLPASAAVRRG